MGFSVPSPILLDTNRLFDLLHPDLRRVAARVLRSQDTLCPTELVNESYLKLASQNNRHWAGRTHFLAVAAKSMRMILVDHARRRKALRRGAGALRVAIDESSAICGGRQIDLLALDEALTCLSQWDERAGRIIELIAFAGCTKPEVAEFMGIALSTVERDHRAAKAWLNVRLADKPAE